MSIPTPPDDRPTPLPDTPPADRGEDEEVPPTPPTEPDPPPVREPPAAPGNRRGPYVVD
jgi:hypothetical protein